MKMLMAHWVYHVTFWACAVSVLWSVMAGWLQLALGVGLLLLPLYWLASRHLQGGTLDPEGRVVLITGCDTGFGHVLARTLSKEGAHVLATCYDVNGDGARELRNLGRENLSVFHLDVTSDESVEACRLVVDEACGTKGLWGLVNNAGICGTAFVELTSLSFFHAMLEVNFLGAVRVTKSLLPLVRAARGRVVNVTSVQGRLAFPSASAYDASKFAMEAFSDVLRLEMKPFGVKVAIVEPGAFSHATGIGTCPRTAEARRNYCTELERMLPADVKAAYPGCITSMTAETFDAETKFLERRKHSVLPVIRALAHALFAEIPNIRYLVDGEWPNKNLDLWCIMARLQFVLPRSLLDRLLSIWWPLPSPPENGVSQ